MSVVSELELDYLRIDFLLLYVILTLYGLLDAGTMFMQLLIE